MAPVDESQQTSDTEQIINPRQESSEGVVQIEKLRVNQTGSFPRTQEEMQEKMGK